MNKAFTSTTLVRLSCAALCTAAFLTATSRPAFAAATVTVVNLNAPGVGFNDPTPAAPVGGNAGTTKGAQRLIAFQHAADLWGATLDSPVPIIVGATFEALGANVLGSAGATNIFRDFPGIGPGFYPGVEFPGTWYGSALADKRAGVDILGLIGTPGPDIRARFSSDFNFYLGLDNNHGALNDLVTVVLHELGHGLNFQTFVDSTTGANAVAGFTDIYARHLLDTSNGFHWNEMTDAQRKESATRFGRLIWDGNQVTAHVPQVLVLGSPELRVLAPATVAGFYNFGTAAFGPRVGTPNVAGDIVAAVDAANAAGPSTTDGCTAFTNAAAIAGKIALVERGTCGFAVKARNATNAGAAAVIIYNNAGANALAAAPGMADDGVNGAFVTIPAVSLNRPDALALLASSLVSANLGVDPTVRAGADASGRARLYAPSLVSPGSSVSHFDTVAFKNLLMEPAISPDLTHKVTAPDDLTLELLRDVGWFADKDLDGVPDDVDCSVNSNFATTIVIGGENTGVANMLFSNGCTTSDLIAQLHDAAKNHGQFVSGVAHLTNDLKDAGLISGADKGAIQSAAAHSK